MIFFFSSRRRHTRSKRDWSSDVCSSDLLLADIDAPCGPDEARGEVNGVEVGGAAHAAPVETHRLGSVFSKYLVYAQAEFRVLHEAGHQAQRFDGRAIISRAGVFAAEANG